MHLNPFAPKWLVVVLFLAFQCKSVGSPALQQEELQELIAKNIGTEYNTTLNTSKTFLLCVQKTAPAKIGTTYTNFIVIELINKRIAAKGKYLYGHCKWIEDTSIEIVDMPGALKENQQTSDFKKIIVIK